ncbi:hypothetical protein [Candidatus Frankia alpina]|uniref:hypothetical protein n=1 Tax=Candidatus Frankia alpina TaxID=2699483 RepID=UPI001A99B2E1|nr:hypothetical protein [Candidatus Frankia alpina]
MNLKEWAAAKGIGYTTARRWYRDGLLPVPARKIGGLVVVGRGCRTCPAGCGRGVRPGVLGGTLLRDADVTTIDARTATEGPGHAGTIGR